MSDHAEGPSFTVDKAGRVPVTTYITAWAWRCNQPDCGWRGWELHNEMDAKREAANHQWIVHHVATCGSGGLTEGWHFWTEKRCGRCGTTYAELIAGHTRQAHTETEA